VFYIAALTKEIHTRPIVKVIGNTEYYVESFFNEEANVNLTGKIKQLIQNDLKSQTDTLLPLQPKVTLRCCPRGRTQEKPDRLTAPMQGPPESASKKRRAIGCGLLPPTPPGRG
jgi:hypothetical protein